jgi:hypothetical protein
MTLLWRYSTILKRSLRYATLRYSKLIWRYSNASLTLLWRYSDPTLTLLWRYYDATQRYSTISTLRYSKLLWRFSDAIVTLLWRYSTILDHLYGTILEATLTLRVYSNASLTLIWRYSDAIMTPLNDTWRYLRYVTRSYCDDTVTLLWRYCDATLTLLWRYSDASLMLLWRYSNAIITLLNDTRRSLRCDTRSYSDATLTRIWRYSDATLKSYDLNNNVFLFQWKPRFACVTRLSPVAGKNFISLVFFN